MQKISYSDRIFRMSPEALKVYEEGFIAGRDLVLKEILPLIQMLSKAEVMQTESMTFTVKSEGFDAKTK